MMKSYLSLAWKEIKAQKVTSVLILIAMILSTTATADLGQSIGILQSMRVEQAASSVELKDSGLTLYLREYQKEALKAYPDVGTLEEGRFP